MKIAHRYGSWALITGASDGIGRALAVQLAADGVNLALAARSEDKLRALATELRAAHDIDTMVLPVDLADPGAADSIDELTSQLDVGLIVLAAGFGTTGTFLETSLADELQLVAVNITAIARLSHTFANRLAARGKGAIMLFGSIVGWQGVPGQANYAASKAYVQSLAEGLHHELAPHGVDVLAVSPGPVDSGFGNRAGLTMTSTTTTEVVAKAALKSLGHRTTVVPGARGKFLTSSLAPLPRGTRSRILGNVIDGMRTPRVADHQRKSSKA